ncbi:MAG TPA: DUF6056 family protein [Luteimonas sp.]|nr:DUF6056 family protein [Luteimonas sp.]
MKSWLARNQDRGCLALAAVAIVALHAFALGNRLVADDEWFARILDQQSLWDFLAFRYAHWSGRIPIEAALVLVVNHPWAWRLLNASMLLLFCHSAGRLALASTGKSTAATTSLAFATLMLASPQVLYGAAWWTTGSVNYLWPAALGLYGMLAFGEPRNRGSLARLACAVASGLAMYNEQVALVLLPASLLVVGALVVQRRWQRWDLVQVAFMAANAALVFSAPGSQRRYVAEQALRFPEFGTLDLLDKAAIGLGLVNDGMADPHNLLVALLVASVAALLLRVQFGKAAKTALYVALGFLALVYVLGALDAVKPDTHAFYLLPRLDGAAASSSRTYALSAWFAFSIACLVIGAVVASWHALREWKGVLVTLLLGLASIAAMGFSPTAYASGSRIQFVCQCALLLVALRMMAAIEREFGARGAKAGIILVAVAAAWRVFRLLA